MSDYAKTEREDFLRDRENGARMIAFAVAMTIQGLIWFGIGFLAGSNWAYEAMARVMW